MKFALLSLFLLVGCNKSTDYYSLGDKVSFQQPDYSEGPSQPVDQLPPVETPEPVVPTPVAPNPVEPTPVIPAPPVVPEPVEPAPVVPAPVVPTPVVPAPVEPTPVVTEPEAPVVPSIPNPPTKPETTAEIPSPDSCRYKVSMTSGESNIKVTVIAAPASKLELADYKEYQALSAPDQDFIKRSVDNSHSNISSVNSKSINQQTRSETLKIGSATPSASLTSIGSNLSLNYFFDGAASRFSANTLKANSKVLLVMNSADSSEVSFTKIQSGSELFVVFLTERSNNTCVRVTGMKGEIASYVVSNTNDDAFSHLEATSFGSDSSVIQSVIADGVAYSSTQSTSLKAAQVSLTSLGGYSSYADVKVTSLGEGASFSVNQKSQQETEFAMKGTSAGNNTLVVLDLKSSQKAKAQFSFTNPSNIEIGGQISSSDSKLELDNRLMKSTSAKVNVRY